MTEQRSEYAAESHRTLELLAQRLEDNPKFMAHLLGQYRRQEGKSREAQQELLGVDAIGFVRLALCRRPVGEPAGFRSQCEQIARYTGANVAPLVQMIRRVDAVQSMEARDTPTQQTQQSNAGQSMQAPVLRAMLAARDRLNESNQYYTPAQADAESAQPGDADQADDQNAEDLAPHSPGNEANPDDNSAGTPSETPPESDDSMA